MNAAVRRCHGIPAPHGRFPRACETTAGPFAKPAGVQRGHEADHDSGFVQVLDVVAVTKRAGFAEDQWLECTSYSHEVKTRRGHLPARRHS